MAGLDDLMSPFASMLNTRTELADDVKSQLNTLVGENLLTIEQHVKDLLAKPISTHNLEQLVLLRQLAGTYK